MIKSLANLIKDEKSFEKSFRDSVTLDHDYKKTQYGNNRNRSLNRVNDLIEASRTFVVGQKEYHFDELENIFFLDKPIN